MSNPLMDMKMDGVPFGEIMNQAVKLKTHQAKPDRWRWDAWPKFKQNTMFARPEIEAARAKENFEDRLKAAYDLKSVADKMFRSRQYLDAAYKYENCTAVFRWLTNKDEGWKKKGILDSDIDEHEYKPENEEEAAKVNAFLVACYLNIARLYHKRADTATALEACTYALDIDDQCDKALLLRAQARIAPKSAGATEQDQSYNDALKAQKVLNIKLNSISTKVENMKLKIKNLKKTKLQEEEDDEGGGGGTEEITGLLELGEDGAFDLDISNSDNNNNQDKVDNDKNDDDDDEAYYSEDDKILLKEKNEILKRNKEVTKYVNNLKTERMNQRELDKEWGGVFNKGVIYDASTSSSSTTVEPTQEENEEVKLKNQITDAQRLLQMYEQNNRHEDADRIRPDVQKAKQNYDNFQQQKKKVPPAERKQAPKTDFFNPTPEMKKDALERGLDLDDPVVLKMLQKLQKSHESGAELSDETIDKAFDSDKQEAMDKLRSEVAPLIEEMTSKELRDALKLLDCKYVNEDGSRMSHEDLVEEMIQIVLYKAEKGESLPDLSSSREQNNGFLSKFISSAAMFFNFNKSQPSPNNDKNNDKKNNKLTPSQLKQLTEQKQTQTFRVTFVLASIFFLFRLWYGGQLGILYDLFKNGNILGTSSQKSEYENDENALFGNDEEEVDYEFLSEF